MHMVAIPPPLKFNYLDLYVPFPFVCVSFNLSFKKKQGARNNELTVKYLEENK